MSGPWKPTWHTASPRMPVTVDGMSGASTPVSVMTTTSQSSRSRRSASRASKFGEPDSSSPSMRNLRFTAGVLRPVAARWARSPSRWNSSWPLSSDAPRARRMSPSIVGSNGSVCHSSSGSTGWTSWCPYIDDGRGIGVVAGPLGEHGRAAGRRPDLDGREPGPARGLGEPLGAAGDVVVVVGLGADARDAQPLVEVSQQFVLVLVDVLALCAHGPAPTGLLAPTSVSVRRSPRGYRGRHGRLRPRGGGGRAGRLGHGLGRRPSGCEGLGGRAVRTGPPARLVARQRPHRAPGLRRRALHPAHRRGVRAVHRTRTGLGPHAAADAGRAGLRGRP